MLGKRKSTENPRTLDNLRPGHSGIVTEITCAGAIKQRLVDMGITPGVELTVVKAAPLGDPVQIHLRGYELSIRKSDAARITVRQTEKKAGKLYANRPGR